MTPSRPDSSLSEKVAIVTGAGSGIGRASSIALAEAGATVVVAGRTLAKLVNVVDEITEIGGKAFAHEVNVAVSAEIQALITATEQTHGGLDIYFGNAGISPSGTVTDTSEELWESCLATNMTSVFLGAKYALPALTRRGGGSFLITAGTFGMRPSKEKAAYSAAKAGAINLVQSIALDYGVHRIRSNAICPGLVTTPLIGDLSEEEVNDYLERYQPLPGAIEASDIAATVTFVVSDLGRFITGQCIVVDGGQQAGLM